MSKVRVVATGGTIDDLEYDDESKAPKDHTSRIPDLLKKTQSAEDIVFCVLCMKDSRFITDDDREALAEKCESFDENAIVITHGTLTMAKTAKYLGPKGIAKTIVLTGALALTSADEEAALRNLNEAMEEAQILPPGVYVRMEGQTYNWDNVRKNEEQNRFEKEK